MRVTSDSLAPSSVHRPARSTPNFVVPPPTATQLCWSGSKLIGEYDSAGDRQLQYIYGAEYSPVHIRADDASGVERVFDVHTDHLSMPRLVTNGSGSVAWRVSYASFGEASADPSSSLAFNVRLPGQYFDGETGLHYNRFRYFDPAVGRYISTDPLRQRARPNVYEYAFNNPLNFFDPFGLYGTQSCSYYDQACSANGGSYECRVAPELCPRFPVDDDPGGDSDPIGNWSDCMRQCLQDKHKDRMKSPDMCGADNNISPSENAADHASCAAGCLSNPENPFDPTGPDLPDNDPSLYGSSPAVPGGGG